MKIIKRSFFLLIFSLSFSCEVLNNMSTISDGIDLSSIGKIPLSESEIMKGLKEALTIGLDKSVKKTSVKDGFLKNQAIKILLPNDVLALKEKIDNNTIASTAYKAYIKKFNGGTDLFQELLTAMNRGAEKAAIKAKPIFVNAVKSMSFKDARSILNGNNTSATDYFYKTTNKELFNAFQPEIKKSLNSTNASKVYKKTYDFLNYNPGKLGLTTIGKMLDITLAPSLDEYVTDKSIYGLFFLVGEEEKKIRSNPYGYANKIIERVFGS